MKIYISLDHARAPLTRTTIHIYEMPWLAHLYNNGRILRLEVLKRRGDDKNAKGIVSRTYDSEATDAVNEFWQEAAKLGVWDWPEYVDTQTKSGFSWHVHLEHEGRTLLSQGGQETPKNFSKFLDLIDKHFNNGENFQRALRD